MNRNCNDQKSAPLTTVDDISAGPLGFASLGCASTLRRQGRKRGRSPTLKHSLVLSLSFSLPLSTLQIPPFSPFYCASAAWLVRTTLRRRYSVVAHRNARLVAIYTVYTSPTHPPIPNHLPTLIVTPHGMWFLVLRWQKFI